MNEKIVALYGAGNKSLQIERVLTAYKKDIKVKYLIENKAFSKIGTFMDGSKSQLEVISIFDMAHKYQNGEIDYVVYSSEYHLFDTREIEQTCLEEGIEDKDLYVVPTDILRKNSLSDEDVRRILVQHNALDQIFHLDIHIVDHCNLGCRGCSHFSPCVSEPVIQPLEKYIKNITQLKKLFSNISHIAILGGEPLLHPQLKDILRITREKYPFSELSIVTNGILLRNMPQELIEEIRKDRIRISLSIYPIMKNQLNQFLEFFREKGLKYNIFQVTDFEKKLLEKPMLDGKKITQKCGHILCMRENRIGRCPMILFTDYYNQHFGNILPESEGYDVFSEDSGVRLLQKLENPAELCSYCCGRDFYYERWEPCCGEGLHKEDWLIPIAD